LLKFNSLPVILQTLKQTLEETMKSKISASKTVKLLKPLGERFATFRKKNHPTSPRNIRYSKELKQIARSVYQQGVSFHQLSEVTGVCKSTMSEWVRNVADGEDGIKVSKLKVVPDREEVRPAVIILPSGVRIEMGGSQHLSGEFLRELASLGRAN
jgi:transposase-like protein